MNDKIREQLQSEQAQKLAELKAAQEALRIAEEAAAATQRAAEEADRELKREEERAAHAAALEARNAKLAVVMAPIEEAMRAAGVAFTVTDGGSALRVETAEGAFRNIKIAAEPEFVRTGSWSSRGTGKTIIRMSGAGKDDRKRFPQLKDGGHNVSSIVTTTMEWLQQAQARVNAERTKAAALLGAVALAEQVRAENGLDSKNTYGRIRSHIEYNEPMGGGRCKYRTAAASAGKVFFCVGNMEVTPEQAKVLLDALKVVDSMNKK